MFELYHNAMSTCSQKVRFCLAEKGLAWTGHHLDLRAAEQQNPAYLKLNPLGVVPTLVHDGALVPESTVINEYLDDLAPTPPLKPAAPLARARMRLWTKQLDEGLHAETGVLSNALAFRFQKLAKGEEHTRKLIEGMPDPAKRERYRSVVFEGVASPLFISAIRRFARLMTDMEEALGQTPWLAGTEFSLADIGLAPYVTRMAHLQLHPMWDDKPGVTSWYEAICARPAYRTSFVDWFDDDYLTLMSEKGAESWPGVKAALAA